MTTLLAQLRAANGRRRERLLAPEDVLGLIRDVARDTTIRDTWVCGGTVATAYHYPAWSTYCLVARVDGRIWAGCALGHAHAASPGRAWCALQNLGNCGVARRAEKIRAWSRSGAAIDVTDYASWLCDDTSVSAVA